MRTKVFLRKKISNRIQAGHQWIFDSEIAIIEGIYKNGDVVDIFSSNGSYVATGWISENAKLKIRLFTREQNESLSESFFYKKITNAIESRKGFVSNEHYYRIFHSECDDISGLIIDCVFDNIYVQYLHSGLLPWSQNIIQILEKKFPNKSILETKYNELRKYENLAIEDNIPYGFYNNTFVTLESIDRRNILHFIYTLIDNQDAYNIWDLCSGRGYFGINIANQKINSNVTIVENNTINIQFVKYITEEQSFQNITIVEKNVFDFLREQISNKDLTKPNIIILDPPAFNTTKGLNAYKDLLIHSMRLSQHNGIIVTGNSSSKISAIDYESMIQDSIIDSKQQWNIIQKIHPTIDVPINLLYPHSDHLHFYALQRRS